MPPRCRRGSAPTRKALPDDLELLLKAEAPTTTSLDNLQPPRLTTISKDIHTDQSAISAPILQDGLHRTLTTYVPEIQEFWNDSHQGQVFVQEIVENITCEVQDAIYELYTQDAMIDPTLKNVSFMNSWGVQIALNLTIDEKGSINPAINWIPPPFGTTLFNFNAGATLSSDAQRVDKVNSFYLVSDLKKSKCPEEIRHRGPFLLESDLKLDEWLFDTVQFGATKYIDYPATDANGPFKSNVLSHEVKFDIVSLGNVTPGWKLTRATINQGGTFLSASRDRTQDLTITFGPVATTVMKDPKTGKTKTVVSPSVAASNAQLASEIGLAVANGIKNALQQPVTVPAAVTVDTVWLLNTVITG